LDLGAEYTNEVGLAKTGVQRHQKTEDHQSTIGAKEFLVGRD
jgi:hypothetical protein